MQAALKIEKGVPLQGGARFACGAAKPFYPFAEMEVGDSIFFPEGTRTPRGTLVTAVTAGTAAFNWGKANGGRKFSTRSVEGGCRVWRTA